MPIVSKHERYQYLERHQPVLFKLCVANELPAILAYRCNTNLPFCYGATDKGSSIPSEWDSTNVKIIPLWESGSGLIAIREYDSHSEFVEISFEDPNEVELIASSPTGLFAYLFYFLIESLDTQDCEELKDIRELAVYLNFKELELIFNSVDQIASEPDYESLWELTRSL